MNYLISIIILFLAASSAMAQENPRAEDPVNAETGEQLPGTADRMLDLQTTRIMEIEDELHALRRQFSRQISDLEEQIFQEQTIIKENVEILRAQISELESRMERGESGREALGRDVERMQREISRFQTAEDELQKSISGIISFQESLRKRLEEISRDLSSLQQEHEDHAAEIRNIQNIQADLKELEQAVSEISNSMNQLSTRMDSDLEKTRKNMQALEHGLEERINELTRKITYTDQGLADRLKQADSELTELGSLLEERTLQVGAISIAAILTGLTGMLLSLAIRRRFKKFRLNIEQRVQVMGREFQEQQTHLDSRLAEIMENIAEALPEPDKGPASGERGVSRAEVDHSLAISLGNEIYTLIKKIRNLHEEDRTAQELRVSLTRLYKAYKQKGYQVIDLEGRAYKETMEAKAEFILTPELLPGEQIVSRVIKPQIKYRESTVQKAEIEVLVGE